MECRKNNRCAPTQPSIWKADICAVKILKTKLQPKHQPSKGFFVLWATLFFFGRSLAVYYDFFGNSSIWVPDDDPKPPPKDDEPEFPEAEEDWTPEEEGYGFGV